MCACVRVCVSRGVGTERGKTVCWLFELVVVVLINPLRVWPDVDDREWWWWWWWGCGVGGGEGGGGGGGGV